MWQERIVFYDLETTGVDPDTCRTVQMAYIIYDAGKAVAQDTLTLNPCQAIDAGASAVHGFKDSDVAKLEKFSVKAQELYAVFNNAYWCGYNNKKFDNVILRREFDLSGFKSPHCLGTLDLYKCFVHFHGKPIKRGTRTLQACHKHYAGIEFDGAHDALADVEAVVTCLRGMLASHPELEDINKALKYSNTLELDIDNIGFFRFDAQSKKPTVAKGKYARIHMNSIPVWYYKWILTASFPQDTKKIALNAIKGVYPVYRA